MNHHRRSAQVWHVFSRDFTVLPAHTHTFIRNRNEPYLPLPSQPQLVFIYRPRRDGRLSRPWCKVTQAEIWTHNLPIANPALYHTATSAPSALACGLRFHLLFSLHLFYRYALRNLAIQATETNKCDLILIWSSPTYWHPTLFKRDAFPIAQPTVSEHWMEKSSLSTDLLTASSPGGGSSNVVSDHQRHLLVGWFGGLSIGCL